MNNFLLSMDRGLEWSQARLGLRLGMVSDAVLLQLRTRATTTWFAMLCLGEVKRREALGS